MGLTMRKALIAAGFFAASSLLATGGSAAAQGFGQVTFGSTTAPATPAPDAAKSAGPAVSGHDVDGLTVTAKRIPDSQKDPNEVLCHDELPMGSRFAKKVCATRRDYAERRAEDRWTLDKLTALRPGSGN